MNQLYACKRKAKGTTEFGADDSVSPGWFSAEQQDRKPGAAGRAPSTGSRGGEPVYMALYSQPDQFCLIHYTTATQNLLPQVPTGTVLGPQGPSATSSVRPPGHPLPRRAVLRTRLPPRTCSSVKNMRNKIYPCSQVSVWAVMLLSPLKDDYRNPHN